MRLEISIDLGEISMRVCRPISTIIGRNESSFSLRFERTIPLKAAAIAGCKNTDYNPR